MGSVVERINELEEAVRNLSAPVVFGDWELRQHSQPYTAETDGFVVVGATAIRPRQSPTSK